RLMPAMLAQARQNLQQPVGLYAKLAIASARSIDPMFNVSLMTLAADLPAADRQTLVAARDQALAAIHAFADELERKLPQMAAFVPMGEENYNWYLKHVYLLPMNAGQVAMLGEAELGRYRGLEAMLPDPSLADPNPARAERVPQNQQEFLQAYESRERGMVQFLRDRKLLTLPDYLGPFYIRQLPDTFKPTSPGGFMNAPGVYDKDPSGFYFIPTYNPKSENFYIRAAIEEPRPILGHEGIPGHFVQISIANHLPDEIRRQHGDGIFTEGWALYTEEMLLRAVRYFMEAGGLDREAAEGEAAGAASEPTQKITYMVGKWQIMRLLGRYKDRMADKFRLGQFHDDLLKSGGLPLSVVEWILLDDRSTLDQALHECPGRAYNRAKRERSRRETIHARSIQRNRGTGLYAAVRGRDPGVYPGHPLVPAVQHSRRLGGSSHPFLSAQAPPG